MKKKKIFLIILRYTILFLIGFTIAHILFGNTSEKYTEISYTEFLQKINSNSIDSITMEKNSTQAIATYKKTDKDITQYAVEIPNQEAFVSFIQERISAGSNGPEFTINDMDSGINFLDFVTLLIGLIPSLLCVFVFFTLFRSLFRKSKDKNDKTPSFMTPFNTDLNYIEKMVKSNVKFSDVAGLDEEKSELIEIVDFLKNPSKYESIGAKIPKGILLSGSPGTGKTLLAKAVAGEAGVSYLAVSGSEFVEKYVGVGASRIRGLFKEARKNAPCIIFIDEIDAIGAKREDGGNSEHNQTLEQLLTELDGFEDRRNIILLAATNRPFSLDTALTRPGRFDRKINVRLPDVKGREEILHIHARGKSFAENIDFKSIAYNTAGYSGAELENLLNESALIAAKKKHEFILKEDIDEALRKITIGLKKTNLVISESERELTAVHEAGHAVVACLLKSSEYIKEVSIIPRGNAGGYTWHNKVEDKSYVSQKELKHEMMILLAGRVAESILLKDISSGASNDLQVATKIAIEMISSYGMGEIGPISLNGLNSSELGILGEKTLSNIGDIIVKLLNEIEAQTMQMLSEPKNMDILRAVSNKLLENEIISGKELDIIFNSFNN